MPIDLSERAISRAFTALITLGAGYLEKIHESALAIEMRAAGLAIVQQYGVKVLCNDTQK